MQSREQYTASGIWHHNGHDHSCRSHAPASIHAPLHIHCYGAAGDQGRWIGIEGATAADGVNSTCATVPAGTVHRKAAVRARGGG
jgi:hypothetical protein